jgi:ribosomal protein S18 acetylase RimI-like enzyme
VSHLVTTYRRSPLLASGALNELFATAWPDHAPRDFAPVLERSLVYIAAFDGVQLVGFVNVAWDGGVHGFVLDTTVHRDHQRRGIGSALLREAAAASCEHGLAWLHVDFEPALAAFYRAAGFAPTDAGLLRLDARERSE